MKSLFSTLAALLLVGLAATPSRGDMAYGVTLLNNQLISVNTADGSASLVGSLTGNVAPFGLSGFNNQLYTFDSTADVIRQISTADGSTVASYNHNDGPVLGQGGLAYQTGTVGYLTTALDPATLNQANNLYQFDISTGLTTLVAHTADALSSIAFAANGTLYGLGQGDGNLYVVDPTTGATTLVGNAGLTIGSPVGALTFGTNGALYATFDDTLYSLSTTTGLATAIGDPNLQTGFASISGLAFANATLPPSLSAVPEPASMLLLASGIVGPAGLTLLRKIRASRAA